jgi:hypothetical protein
MENNVVKKSEKTTLSEIKKWFEKEYRNKLDVEKLKYALAFCLENKLNPAKGEVSLIPNKAGILNPVIDYQKQLQLLDTYGYSKKLIYIPTAENPVAIKCEIYKGDKLIGDYVGYVEEWQGKIGRPKAMCRIRTITQAIKENVPEMKRQLNNFEINEVLASQNKQIDLKQTSQTLKEITNKSLDDEVIKNFVEQSDLGDY